MKKSPDRLQPADMESTLSEFIDANYAEIVDRYNTLLPSINAAQGRGIISIHNLNFGAKGMLFGPAVQVLYRQHFGLPIEINSNPSQANTRQHDEVSPISQQTSHSASKHSRPADENYSDASEFIAEHASEPKHRKAS